jgi:hypothetical protein
MYHLYSRCGINSNTNIKSSLQIQLTEIKKQLHKKKLKNLEISSGTNMITISKSIGKIKEGKSIINTTTTLNHTSINTLNTINNNLNIKSINFSTTHKKNVSNTNTNSFRSINLNPAYSTNQPHTNHIKTISNPYIVKNNKLNTISSSNLNFSNKNINDVNVINFNSENINNYTKEIINGTNNSKIFVVSRDSNIRFKSDLENEWDYNSGEDSNLSNQNVKNVNTSMKDDSYNTPTKKKVMRYYS